jgi:hypothetical protein
MCLFASCQTGLESMGVGTVVSVCVMMLIVPPRAGVSGTERISCCG